MLIYKELGNFNLNKNEKRNIPRSPNLYCLH